MQRLQVARRELTLEAAISKLDKYHLLILDDLAYVTKDQAETSVLFELISARYEQRSILITANQPFGEWGRIFPDPAMTLAAVDRLVHHATIFELNVDSYRRRTALEQKRSRGRPAARATITTRRQPARPKPLHEHQTRDTRLLILIVAYVSSRLTRYTAGQLVRIGQGASVLESVTSITHFQASFTCACIDTARFPCDPELVKKANFPKGEGAKLPV